MHLPERPLRCAPAAIAGNVLTLAALLLLPLYMPSGYVGLVSSYPNVKGTATLAAASSTKAVGTNPIKATGADMNLMVLAVLVLAAAMVGGFACVARKHK